MIGWFFSTVLCLALGFLYPAYASFKALKTASPDDDKQWLVYWIIYGFLNVAEYWLFLGTWFPLYYELKLVFVLWLMLPQTRGATMLWNQHVEPWLRAHEEEIDAKIDQAASQAGSLAAKGIAAAKDQVTKAVVENMANSATEAVSKK